MSLFSRLSLLSLLLGTISFPYTSHAAEMTQPHQDHHGTFISFSTIGEAKTQPTELTLHFSAQVSSHSVIEAQKMLNKMTEQALSLAKTQNNITAQAKNYTIEEEYSQHGPKNWNAHQELTLTARDTKTLFNLAEKLQNQGLLLNSIEWTLDSATYTQLEAQARKDALSKIRPELEEDAHILGMKLVNIDHIQIGTQGFTPHLPMQNFMMLRSARTELATAPQATPSEQIIHVPVTVRAYLGKE